ncbi:hypothetical protein [Ruegeria aquimaris]|uniref:DUF1795 domain-containing protein n=1 Tax=Ruegeria aquimaris TaxID=2984333 RepID=A0ABT3ALJ1_9RHOB|nr:hypothetical protein [Ruegeria sp. XHP0148]MCV2889550.1 hypothetical protein [Ruegeria sp. XHP0148]
MPRSLKSLRWLALVASLLPMSAVADMPLTYVSDGEALFHLKAPDFWQVRSGGPRALTPPGSEEARLINRVIGLEPEAEPGVWVGFMSPNGVSTFAQAEEYLRNIGKSVVSDPELREQNSIRVGGLPAARYAGTGRRNGRAVEFTAVLVDLPGSRVAISLAVVEAVARPELVEDINAIYASFRAAN